MISPAWLGGLPPHFSIGKRSGSIHMYRSTCINSLPVDHERQSPNIDKKVTVTDKPA
jgi:hypothetical protein